MNRLHLGVRREGKIVPYATACGKDPTSYDDDKYYLWYYPRQFLTDGCLAMMRTMTCQLALRRCSACMKIARETVDKDRTE